MTTDSSTPAPTLASQVSRAVVWNTIFAPLRMLSEVVATIVKLWMLTAAQYGFLSVVRSASNGFGTYIDLGTGRTLPKYIPETLIAGGPRAVRRLLYMVLAAQCALLALIGAGLAIQRESFVAGLNQKIAAIPGADTSDQTALISYIGGHGWLLLAAVLMMLLFGIFYDVLMAYLSAFFKQRAWNSIDLVAKLLPQLMTIGAVVLLPQDMRIAGLLAVMVAAPGIATALLIWHVVRHQREIDQRPQPADSGPLLPVGFVRYCAVSLLMTGSDFLASAEFAVFFARNVIDVALLTAGVSIVKMVLGYLYTPMVGVQVPLFTHVRAGTGGTINGAYRSLIRLQALLLIPGGVGLMVLAPHIFTLLLRPEYAPAAALVWVLVPCLFLESLLTTAHNALIVYERLREIIIGRVLTLLVVPLVIVLTPQFGIVGASLAFGLARLAAGAWVTARGAQLLGLRWPWRFTLRVAGASVAMAAAVWLLANLLPTLPADPSAVQRLAMLPALLGLAAVGGAVLLGALRLLGGLEPEDRAQLAKMKLPAKKWILRLI